MIEKYTLDATYTKENGLWLLNVDSPNLPTDFPIRERNIVYIPAGEFGGNHMHPRSEAFVGVGSDLELLWQDDNGQQHAEVMNPDRQDGTLTLFVIQPMTPHVVVNRGKNPAILIEFADGAQHDVEPANLLLQE